MQVIRDSPREEQRFHVDFYLKPYLRDFVRKLCGGDVFYANQYSVVGSMALSSLTTKQQSAHQVDPSWYVGREKVVGTIGIRNAEREGMRVNNLTLFESLIEHFFKHTMLVHVDLRMQAGMRQQDAIQDFLLTYEIDLKGIAFDTFARALRRRRHRATEHFTPAKTSASVSDVRKAS